MQTVSTISAARAALARWRAAGEHIALVPTMGNLHQGHMSLVEKARQVADRVVVSIFVNPMQFGVNEDFSRYPRTLHEDSLQLGEANVDLLFTPDNNEIYGQGFGQTTRIEVPGVSEGLCGGARPGHFAGVSTVVAKLFNIIQPNVAVFGEKDFQQLMVIRKMVADLFMPIAVVGVPTKRDSDGLALSSRNGYLSAEERALAPLLYQQLQSVAASIRAGHNKAELVIQQAALALREKGFDPDYLELRRAVDLAPASDDDVELVLLVAARLGATRLIDNIVFNRSA